MNVAKISASSPSDDETFNDISMKDITFLPIPTAQADIVWLASDVLLLFSTSSLVTALIKVGTLTTTGLEIKISRMHSYLVSVGLQDERYIVRAAPLNNGDPMITKALQRDILRTHVPTTDALIESLRIIAEYSVFGVHDGCLSERWMQLPLAPIVAKTTTLRTNRSRPIGVALLMSAPTGAWYVQLTSHVVFVRPNDRMSHILFVENSSDALVAALSLWSSTPNYPFVQAAELVQFSNNERDAWQLILVDAENAARLLESGKTAAAHTMVEHILHGN